MMGRSAVMADLFFFWLNYSITEWRKRVKGVALNYFLDATRGSAAALIQKIIWSTLYTFSERSTLSPAKKREAIKGKCRGERSPHGVPSESPGGMTLASIRIGLLFDESLTM